MRMTRRMILYLLGLVGGCFFVTQGIVCAQGQTSAPFFELKTCERELRVFEDGTVLESRDGKKIERQLSKDRLRTLREILANLPCPLQWQQLPASDSSDPKIGDVEVTLGMSQQCHVPMIVSGKRPPGLQQVQMILRTVNTEGGSSVFLACESPSSGDREWLKRNAPEYIKPKWKLFLSEVDQALGGKSILKGCECETAAIVR